jgi:uncharacterized membrane protein YGL010W
VGIPLIVLSLLLLIASFWVEGLWVAALSLFVVGWIFQFVGHAVEGKPPEFFMTGASCLWEYAGGSPR